MLEFDITETSFFNIEALASTHLCLRFLFTQPSSIVVLQFGTLQGQFRLSQ